MARLLPVTLACALVACSGGKTREHTEPDPYCGDGAKNGPEACDGSDLGGATCVSLGYVGGGLSCAADCTVDAIGCSRTCGDGKVDLGDECDGTDLAGQSCPAWGAVRCDDRCRLVRRCSDAPFVEAQRQTYPTAATAYPATRLRDGVETAELFVRLDAQDRFEIQRFDKDLGFVADRLVAFDPGLLAVGQVEVGDFDGDGSTDIAVLDGSALLLKRATATGFETLTLTVGCSPVRMLAFPDKALFVDCLDGLIPLRVAAAAVTASAKLPLPEPTPDLAFADVTGDGHGDLLARVPSSSAVAVLAGETFADRGKRWAAGLVTGAFQVFDADGDRRPDLLTASGKLLIQGASEAFSPREIGAYGSPFDVDGDGASDLVSFQEGTLSVARNSGLDFTRRLELLSGFSLARLALADVQQDGDVDLVVSGTFGGTHQVVWLRNATR